MRFVKQATADRSGRAAPRKRILTNPVPRRLVMIVAIALLSACGSGDNTTTTEPNPNTARGTLVENPPLRVASLTASALAAELNTTPAGQQLVQVTGAPVCGVDVHYIHYATVGGAGETTSASGALMIPTGAAGTCSGPRPILVYAHGTTTDRAYNIANISDPGNSAAGEGSLIAAMFAAQGYIVVAPNYAGYDSSPLPYHPYLNADQSSKEMIDALAAARQALGKVFAASTTDNGKLFLTGYSQGGHVAMATHKAMQAAGMKVTASAPLSGPYALASFGDAIVFGNVNLGSTAFLPLIWSSYRNSYPTITTKSTDVYETAFATGIDALVPSKSFDLLVMENKLPQTALFSSTPPVTGNATLDALFVSITPPTTPAAQAPLFALGFGTNNLVRNSFRVAYVSDALAHPDGVVPTATTGLPPAAPANDLRVALKTNDLRNWQPAAPVLLCGGNADPTVYYNLNTQVIQAFWAMLPAGLVTTLDVDSAPTGATDPFAAAKLGFAQAKAQVAAGGANAVVQAYHGSLVPPFCAAAARGFFSQF